MLKILQVRLQQTMNRELPQVKEFRKARGSRHQIANVCWIIVKARELKNKQPPPQKKKVYFCFIDYAKAFDCVDHNEL